MLHGKRSYNITSLQRGLRLLQLFAQSERGLTAKQVTKLSGLPFSTVPAWAPVASPSSKATAPFTRVALMPSAFCTSRRAPPGRSRSTVSQMMEMLASKYWCTTTFRAPRI